MSFDYSYVLPPTGIAENAQVREMFEDVKAYVNTLISGGGTGAPSTSQYVVLTADSSLSAERVLTAGLGISLTDNGAGSTVVVANTGVWSLSTTNVNSSFSAATGVITFSFSTTPTFASIIFQSATGAVGLTPSGSVFTSYNLTLPLDTGTPGQFLKTNGATPTATLSWGDTGGVSDIHGTTSQISVSATTGSVTLSTPQDIATTSSPTFVSVDLGNTSGSAHPIRFGGTLDGISHDSSSRAITMQSQSATAKIEQLGSSSHGVFGLFTSSGGIKGSYLRLIDSGTIDIVPYTGASYTLTLPPDDGTVNQYLTTDGSGNLTWTNAAGTGTVNTGTANRLAYYASSTNAVSAYGAITANMALISDANGLPVSSVTTSTELANVSGVTSAIQTQLNAKAPLASPTFTGTVTAATLDAQTLLKGAGTATNDSAAAGYIGEYVESNQTSTLNAPTSTQLGDVTSIPLTAGDWEVTGNASWTLNTGVAVTLVEGGISVTSGNSATGLTYGVNRFQNPPPTANYDVNIPIATYRLSLSGSATVYLKASATFASGNPKMYGSIRARRAR